MDIAMASGEGDGVCRTENPCDKTNEKSIDTYVTLVGRR